MIKALLLIFDPGNTWEGIDKAQRSVLTVSVIYLFPLVFFCAAVEGYCLVKFGRAGGPLDTVLKVSPAIVIRYELIQVLLNLVIVFGGAGLLTKIGAGFHSRHSYTKSFVTLAYSLGPLFLLQMADGWPVLNTWLVWAIGIVLSVSVLYTGIPRVLRPEPSNALGLYMMISLLMIIATGLKHFVAVLVLNEQIVL